MPRGAPHTVMGSAVSIDTCLVFGNFLPLLRNTSVFLARITGDINCFNKVNRRRKTARHSPFFARRTVQFTQKFLHFYIVIIPPQRLSLNKILSYIQPKMLSLSRWQQFPELNILTLDTAVLCL